MWSCFKAAQGKLEMLPLAGQGKGGFALLFCSLIEECESVSV